jgi:hypothetical protein
MPLGAGIVLEREPASLGFFFAFVFVIAIRQAEKTEVSEAKYCEFALNCLLIDMLILDDVSSSC